MTLIDMKYFYYNIIMQNVFYYTGFLDFLSLLIMFYLILSYTAINPQCSIVLFEYIYKYNKCIYF